LVNKAYLQWFTARCGYYLTYIHLLIAALIVLLVGLALWVAPAYEQGFAVAQHESYVLAHWISRHPANAPNLKMLPLKQSAVGNTEVVGQRDPAIVLAETLMQFHLMVKSSNLDSTALSSRQSPDQGQSITSSPPSHAADKQTQIHLSLEGDLKDFILARELIKAQHPEIVLVRFNAKKAPEDKQASMDSVWDVIANSQVSTS
jgi:hypothetical protein